MTNQTQEKQLKKEVELAVLITIGVVVFVLMAYLYLVKHEEQKQERFDKQEISLSKLEKINNIRKDILFSIKNKENPDKLKKHSYEWSAVSTLNSNNLIVAKNIIDEISTDGKITNKEFRFFSETTIFLFESQKKNKILAQLKDNNPPATK